MPDRLERIAPTYQVLVDDIKALGVEQVFGLMSDDTAVFATALDSARHPLLRRAPREQRRRYGRRLLLRPGWAGHRRDRPRSCHRQRLACVDLRQSLEFARADHFGVGDAATPSGQANGIGPDYKALNAQGVFSAAGIRTFTATSPATARGALARCCGRGHAGWRGGRAAAGERAARRHGARGRRHATRAARRTSAAGTAAAGHRSGGRVAAPEPQARDPGRPRRAPCRRQGRARAARRANRRAAGDLGARQGTCSAAIPAISVSSVRSRISAARRLMAEADCVLAFGASLNLLTMSFGHSLPKVPLIQVDAQRASIGRYHPADVGRSGRCAAGGRGDGGGAARRLQRGAAVPFGRDAEVSARVRYRQGLPTGQHARTVDPRSLGVALEKLLPARRNLVYDAGNFLGIRALSLGARAGTFQDDQRLRLDRAGLRHGARRGQGAAPTRTTVLVIGDGGFLMTMGELETVVREGPAVGDRVDERLRLRRRAAFSQDAGPAGRQVGVPGRRLRTGCRGFRLPSGDRSHAR